MHTKTRFVNCFKFDKLLASRFNYSLEKVVVLV